MCNFTPKFKLLFRLMCRKSYKYLLFLIAFVCAFVSCNKGKEDTSKPKSEELQNFEKYVYETRMRLLYEHTYDPANIPVADSIYEEAERLHSDWCKLRALELKYYVYVADSSKQEEFFEAIDEYLKIASSSEEYKQEMLDGTYAKVQYLITQKRYISAQEIVGDLMKDYEKTKYTEGMYTCNYLMGAIYQNRGDYSMAIPYLNKSALYAENDSMHLSLVSRELSLCYQNIGKYDEALSYARQSWKYATNRVYKIWGEYTYISALYEAGREKEFIQAYENSVISVENVNDVLPDYMKFGLDARVASARKEWDKAEAIAQKIQYEKYRHGELLSIYLNKGDFRKAYETKKKIDMLNDSVRSKMQTEDLNEMEVRLGNTHLKLEADELKIANQRYMIAAVIVALVLVIMAIAISAVYIVRRRSARYKRKSMEERELFYRNVTHQLRTPMTVVLGMVEQLKQHIPQDDVIGHESLAAAHRQSDNLLELIKKLIAASKEGVTVDLSDINTSPSAANPLDSATAPASSVVRPLPAGRAVPHVANAISSSSILVAEDNDDVAMLICNMLRDKGYEVNRAADGQEAFDMLQEELPDMLITDIAMPRMDGLELMRKVRGDDTMCCLPIVVVSARVEDHERLDGISAGAEVYLAKPFINEELLLIVNRLLEQRKRLKQMFTNSKSDAETSRQVPEVDVEFFNDINKLIDTNLISGDVSTSFLADKLSTSVSTLNRRLKNMSGLTATTYIRNRRILMAKRLLETTDAPISEIEVQCGFNTSGHFSRVFKAETGISPLDYRKQQAMG